MESGDVLPQSQTAGQRSDLSEDDDDLRKTVALIKNNLMVFHRFSVAFYLQDMGVYYLDDIF